MKEALKDINELDISEWITYFCRNGIKQDFIKDDQFHHEKGNSINSLAIAYARQAKVIERIFNEGTKGFDGGLSAKNYQTISGIPSATCRDLTKLI